jgi:hypothetical protein
MPACVNAFNEEGQIPHGDCAKFSSRSGRSVYRTAVPAFVLPRARNSAGMLRPHECVAFRKSQRPIGIALQSKRQTRLGAGRVSLLALTDPPTVHV